MSLLQRRLGVRHGHKTQREKLLNISVNIQLIHPWPCVVNGRAYNRINQCGIISGVTCPGGRPDGGRAADLIVSSPKAVSYRVIPFAHYFELKLPLMKVAINGIPLIELTSK